MFLWKQIPEHSIWTIQIYGLFFFSSGSTFWCIIKKFWRIVCLFIYYICLFLIILGHYFVLNICKNLSDSVHNVHPQYAFTIYVHIMHSLKLFYKKSRATFFYMKARAWFLRPETYFLHNICRNLCILTQIFYACVIIFILDTFI